MRSCWVADSQRLFDFKPVDSVQSMQIACYRLEDGEWKSKVGGWRQFTNPNGQLALGFKDLREGLRTAVQSEHSSGRERSDRPAADDKQSGIATMTLASEASVEENRRFRWCCRRTAQPTNTSPFHPTIFPPGRAGAAGL